MATGPMRSARLVTTGFVLAAIAWLVDLGLTLGGIASWDQVVSLTIIFGLLSVIYLRVWRGLDPPK